MNNLDPKLWNYTLNGFLKFDTLKIKLNLRGEGLIKTFANELVNQDIEIEIKNIRIEFTSNVKFKNIGNKYKLVVTDINSKVKTDGIDVMPAVLPIMGKNNQKLTIKEYLNNGVCPAWSSAMKVAIDVMKTAATTIKGAVNTYCESNHLKSDLECKAGSYVGTAKCGSIKAYELGKCHAKNIPGYASYAASKIGGYASHAACKAACYANRKINCGSDHVVGRDKE